MKPALSLAVILTILSCIAVDAAQAVVIAAAAAGRKSVSAPTSSRGAAATAKPQAARVNVHQGSTNCKSCHTADMLRTEGQPTASAALTESVP